MPRYFIEVTYKGTGYSGFQVQDNANSIQAEVEKALGILFRVTSSLTGSSRTDAGVHARQNFFHLDTEQELEGPSKSLYHLNAILPADIVIKNIIAVTGGAHCRFDATSREYSYHICNHKDPFSKGISYYYPYGLNMEYLQEASNLLLEYNDFTSFSKRNTQVQHFICNIMGSSWQLQGNMLVYNVMGNCFLRGMVRGLVGTMLRVGRGKITVDEFREIIESRDCTKAKFDVPPDGLFLMKVSFQANIFLPEAVQ